MKARFYIEKHAQLYREAALALDEFKKNHCHTVTVLSQPEVLKSARNLVEKLEAMEKLGETEIT